MLNTGIKDLKCMELLDQFIDWAASNKLGVWFIFDQKEKAIEQFMRERNNE